MLPLRVRNAVAVSAFVQVMVWTAIVLAQTSGNPSKESTTGESAANAAQMMHKEVGQASTEPAAPRQSVRQVGPDTFFIVDEDGQRWPMIGMSYEDFVSVWERMQSGDQRSADDLAYTIDELQIDGVVHGAHAELSVKFRISLLTDATVTIPLRMGRAILRGQPDSTNDDTLQHVFYDESQGGYVARMQSETNSQIDIRVGILVPLESVGSETQLRLNCRRAAVSKLVLRVNTHVESADTSHHKALTIDRDEEGLATLIAEGFGGQWELRWRADESLRRALPSVLSSNGSILAVIDGRSVRADAWLTIQSTTGTFDECYVQLPSGAVALHAQEDATDALQTSYSAEFLPSGTVPPGAGPAVGEGSWVHVKFHGNQTGPVNIHLRTETPLESAGDDLVARLGGFSVWGAVRQYGDLGIMVADDWQLRWSEGTNLRQVNSTSVDERFMKSDVRATFQYDRQSWSLPVRIARRKSQMLVTPRYQLELLHDEARLRLDLKYYIPDARVYEFRVKLHGWEVTSPVNSGGLVETDVQNDQDELVLFLRDASPRSTQLVLEARRDIAPDADHLDLLLPAPVADIVSPGELHVVVAPGLAIKADQSNIVGLAPEPISGPLVEEAVDFGQRLAFRTFLPQPTFAASRAIRSQRIDTNIDTVLRIGTNIAEVEQLIEYQVQHHPVDRLSFEVPPGLMNEEIACRLELLESGDLDSQGEMSLNGTAAMEPASGGAAGENRRIQVSLPSLRLGFIRVRVRHFVTFPVGGNDVNSQVRIPLIVPLDGVLNRHILSARAEPPMSMVLANDQKKNVWNLDPPRSRTAEEEIRAIAFDATDMLSLKLGGAQERNPKSTFIDRAWMQSWIVAGVRQDRVVYQFRTNEPEAVVELPDSVSHDLMTLILNGRQASVDISSSGPLRIPIGDVRLTETQTLEVSYQVPETDSLVHRLQITPPRLVGSWAAHQARWHLVLPDDSYILSTPRSLSGDGRWGWRRLFWGRGQSWSQPELEQWAGASTQLSPAVAANEYVFASLAPLSSIELIMARRWVIVFGTSAVALLIGLAIVYSPWTGTAGAVAVLGVGLAVLAIAYPAPALFLGQAATLGIVLALLAAGLRRAAIVRSPRYRSPTGSSAARIRGTIAPDSRTPTPVAGLSVGQSSSAPARVSDSHL